jgi:hypothetical protein
VAVLEHQRPELVCQVCQVSTLDLEIVGEWFAVAHLRCVKVKHYRRGRLVVERRRVFCDYCLAKIVEYDRALWFGKR